MFQFAVQHVDKCNIASLMIMIGHYWLGKIDEFGGGNYKNHRRQSYLFDCRGRKLCIPNVLVARALRATNKYRSSTPSQAGRLC